MRVTKTVIAGLAAAIALPLSAQADGDKSSYDKDAAGERYVIVGADTADSELTDAEIRDIIARAGAPEGNADVRYMGGSQVAIETTVCCEDLEEQIETRTDIEETTTYVDVISRRDIIQPVERTLIQPIERRILQGSVEDITEDMRYEENRLPLIVERDEVPAIVENYIPQLTVENTEEITETYIDVITERDVIQPIERTTVVPVQRRIVRPVTETITNDTRYETIRAPLDRREQPIPETIETLTEDVTTVTQEQITETIVPYVQTRNVYQPMTRTTIQPIERQILRPTTETITEDTRYEEERLPLIVNTDGAPQLMESIIPKVTERTVMEVEDVYIDQVTRNIIQPVVVTTIQPIENVLVTERHETITNDVRYEEEILSGIIEDVRVPDTVVHYIPQVQEDYVEERSETYFEAVTQRDIYQPVKRTIIQPIENRRVNAVKETVTNPTRYETVRASLVVLNVGAPCNCN
ncbi:MAG: hypothetical protein AAFZ91_02855 [Pseudomonadota bacterium]